MTECQFDLPFASWPVLTASDKEDASFRGKDLAWSSLAGLFDDFAESDDSLNYQSLGDRIGRTRAQVQRWICSPHNMTLKSLSLIAEGLDADLTVGLCRRVYHDRANFCHPAESAKADLPFRVFKERLAIAAALTGEGGVKQNYIEVPGMNVLKERYSALRADNGYQDIKDNDVGVSGDKL